MDVSVYSRIACEHYSIMCGYICYECMSDLLKQLRHESDIFRKGGANGRADLIGNAADLIEKLHKRSKELEDEINKINYAGSIISL